MTTLCASLSSHWGLSLKGFETVGTFTNLTYLSLVAPNELERRRVPDCLTRLRNLKELELAYFTSLPPALSSLPSLAELHLAPRGAQEQDLTGYSRLTSLDTWFGNTNYYTMLLHLGDALQRLSLQRPCHIANLDAATRLTCIELCGDVINHCDWPPELPFLQVLHTTGKTDDAHRYSEMLLPELPMSWQGYTSLTDLNVAPIDMLKLPNWLSNLQQLTSLTLRRAYFHDFPTVMFSLSKLQHLELPELTLCVLDHLTQLASLSRLTHLEIGLYRSSKDGVCKHTGLEHTYDQYNIQSGLPASLLQLQAALGPSAQIEHEYSWMIKLVFMRKELDPVHPYASFK